MCQLSIICIVFTDANFNLQRLESADACAVNRSNFTTKLSLIDNIVNS